MRREIMIVATAITIALLVTLLLLSTTVRIMQVLHAKLYASWSGRREPVEMTNLVTATIVCIPTFTPITTIVPAYPSSATCYFTPTKTLVQLELTNDLRFYITRVLSRSNVTITITDAIETNVYALTNLSTTTLPLITTITWITSVQPPSPSINETGVYCAVEGRYDLDFRGLYTGTCVISFTTTTIVPPSITTTISTKITYGSTTEAVRCYAAEAGTHVYLGATNGTSTPTSSTTSATSSASGSPTTSSGFATSSVSRSMPSSNGVVGLRNAVNWLWVIVFAIAFATAWYLVHRRRRESILVY